MTYTVCTEPNALGETGDWMIYDDRGVLVGRMMPRTAIAIYGASLEEVCDACKQHKPCLCDQMEGDR